RILEQWVDHQPTLDSRDRSPSASRSATADERPTPPADSGADGPGYDAKRAYLRELWLREPGGGALLHELRGAVGAGGGAAGAGGARDPRGDRRPRGRPPRPGRRGHGRGARRRGRPTEARRGDRLG